MSRIEDAMKKAQRARDMLETRNRLARTEHDLIQERGINVLIVSRDPKVSATINHINSLFSSDIIAAGDVESGMEAFSRRYPQRLNGHDLRFTALMLDLLCHKSSVPSSGLTPTIPDTPA